MLTCQKIRICVKLGWRGTFIESSDDLFVDRLQKMTAVHSYPSGFSSWGPCSDTNSMSPPPSPGSPDEKFTNNSPWGTRHDTTYLPHTGVNHGNNSAAKQAVCDMDIPEHLVQLAIDIQFLRHQRDFENVIQLYDFASQIASSPEMQMRLAKELHEARRNTQQEVNDNNKQLPDTVEEDGMEVDEPSCKDVVDGAHPSLWLQDAQVSPSSSAEMSEIREDKCSKASLQDLMAENKKLKHRKLCRVCRKTELAVSGITFLPCGHFITCEDCAENCDDCPACGKNIMGTVRTFLS
ncbi:hypothetical protein BaRGS_00015522 [Batillaria attramentaria]|uniref:RING-type domain-containing protein n=1 Tax=Batillaria attramentaria TaxID=370345 RepID=A0ABD0L1B9_9CAEN